MARTACFIQNDASDIHAFIKHLIPHQQWRDPACSSRRIHNQNYRGLNQFGHRGIGIRAVQVDAIVQTFVTFDDRNVRTNSATGKKVADFSLVHSVEIEVIAGPAAGQSQPHRINVIGAFFEGLHRHSTLAKCAREAR